MPTNRLKGFFTFLSLHQVERFGDRDVGKGDARAAHVGAPNDREGTGAGGERQRRDGRTSAQGVPAQRTPARGRT